MSDEREDLGLRASPKLCPVPKIQELEAARLRF
jgi:hypothetical protein